MKKDLKFFEELVFKVAHTTFSGQIKIASALEVTYKIFIDMNLDKDFIEQFCLINPQRFIGGRMEYTNNIPYITIYKACTDRLKDGFFSLHIEDGKIFLFKHKTNPMYHEKGLGEFFFGMTRGRKELPLIPDSLQE